ncbi:MAG: sodium-independent anion transporter, partial [Clostridia bacterium]|nr:sodium-independent anion transporter [Clostridia bacterium]
DATGLHSFERIIKTCEKKGIVLILSHVNEQPMKAFVKSGMYEKIGAENFCDNIDEALARAEAVQK